MSTDLPPVDLESEGQAAERKRVEQARDADMARIALELQASRHAHWCAELAARAKMGQRITPAEHLAFQVRARLVYAERKRRERAAQ